MNAEQNQIPHIIVTPPSADTDTDTCCRVRVQANRRSCHREIVVMPPGYGTLTLGQYGIITPVSI
jgi:hypothetical protein